MVMMIENSQDSDVNRIGQDIVKSQTAEIELMKELLKRK
jgi:uncharacterized protein (DUF305 family)